MGGNKIYRLRSPAERTHKYRHFAERTRKGGPAEPPEIIMGSAPTVTWFPD
jgi:hypothetical protein